MNRTDLALWVADEPAQIPSNISGAQEMAPFAKRLNDREKKQIVQAFEAGSYEMGSTFLWSRTMAGLKNQLTVLGAEFVAEILGRQDISPFSDLSEVLTDYEAVRLAQDLGVVSRTQALRLRHAFELVSHFSSGSNSEDQGEMSRDEASTILRTCLEAVLGHEQVEVASEFAEFRNRLESTVLDPESRDLDTLLRSPYFFKRTAIRTLLASSKTATGVKLENALANVTVVVPQVWGALEDPDRFSVGRAYSEFHAEGKLKPSNAVRSALLKVQGFDYVPESYRSQEFLEAASTVIEAHFGWDNFYNEPAPVRLLETLGSSIPGPAFHKVMTALLLVRIGNRYGVSGEAQEPANRMLEKTVSDRWKYFIEKCLPVDQILLEELSVEVIAERFCEVVGSYNHTSSVQIDSGAAAGLWTCALKGKGREVAKQSRAILEKLH